LCQPAGKYLNHGIKGTYYDIDYKNILKGEYSMNDNMSLLTTVTAKYAKGSDCLPNRRPFPPETPEAMAYVPFQQLKTTYDPEKGLQNGTIFPELNKPFLGGGVGR
jgi:hypothetical protein